MLVTPGRDTDAWAGGDELVEAVVATYRAHGLLEATASLRVAVDGDDTAVLEVAISEGPVSRVSEVSVEGATAWSADQVRAAAGVEVGAVYAAGLAEAARAEVLVAYRGAGFNAVRVRVELTAVPQPAEPDAPDEPVTARVTLEEGPLYRLRYGVQVIDERASDGAISDRGQFGVVADLTRRNLFGRAITAGTAVRYDTVQQAVRGFMTLPSFLGRRVTSNLFVSRLRETFGPDGASVISARNGLTLEQQIRPREGLTVSYSYNFDRDHTFDEDFDPADPFAFDLTVDIARLNTSLVLERRDDLFNATRGWFHASTVEWGVETLGSDLRFLKYVG